MTIKKKDIDKIKAFFDSMDKCKFIKTDRPKSGHQRVFWSYKGIKKKAFLSSSGKRGFDQCFKPFKRYIKLDIIKIEEELK